MRINRFLLLMAVAYACTVAGPVSAARDECNDKADAAQAQSGRKFSSGQYAAFVKKCRKESASASEPSAGKRRK